MTTLRSLAFPLLFSLAACHGAPREEPRHERPSRVELGHEAEIVYRRTLVRDPVPTCAELTAGVTRPGPALLEGVERTTAPPWSGMRAATCLVREHASEIEPQMTSWVTRRATMGLGLLVLNELDRLELSMAVHLARAALSGEYADRARPRIARSSRGAELLSSTSAGATVAP